MADWAETWSKRVSEEDRAEIHGTSFETQTGAAAIVAIRAACPHKRGSTFPGDSSLVMTQHPRITGDLGVRDVVCYFERPNFGENPNTPGDGSAGDPLLQPPRISWGRQTVIQPSDIDIDGNAIRNAAGDPYEPRLNRTIISRTFTITKNMLAYPLDLADEYEDTVNEKSLTAKNGRGGSIVFAAETIKCLSIMPAGEFPADAPYVPVAATFERRTGKLPWREPVVNKGRQGWATINGTVSKAAITTSTGQPISDDVLLDNTGKPLDTSLKVEGATPVASPSPGTTGYTNMSDAPGPAKIHLWKMNKLKDFNVLIGKLGL